MDALLREVRPSADGIAEYRDIEISADVITLGSAPDRTIQLLGTDVAPDHAELHPAQKGVKLRCRHGNRVTIEGRAVASATLSPGDSFEIGGNRLVVVDPPVGFDIGVQIELDQNIDASVFENAFRTDLSQTAFSVRRTAWLLSALIVLGAMVIPLILSGTVGIDLSDPVWIPGDEMWSSGPLHPAHTLATGDDCRTCHVRAFERVSDAACKECHANIDDHIHAEKLSRMASLGPAPRCAACHREHNEPGSYLVIRADRLCTDCHAHARQLYSDMETWPVRGFSELSHPAFAAHLLKPTAKRAGTGLRFTWQTSVEYIKDASEVSNLKFPHDTHLDPGLVADSRDGSALECQDCHELSLDREHFVPISMEASCVQCHELSFDPQMPDRQLPHGQPLEVILTLEGQYLRKFSDPDVPQEARVRRRIPGRDNAGRDCVDTAFACAADAASSDIREQFTVRGCVSCHVVEEHPTSDIYARYQVHPVRLTTDYFPVERFDHFSHQVMKDKTGNDACTHCHEARASSSSTDLLMPDIDTCTQCHSDAQTPDRVALRCVNCHAYHPFTKDNAATMETGS